MDGLNTGSAPKYPKWIDVRQDYAPPPRCSNCGRLIAFDSKGENLQCKCGREMKKK